MLRDLAGHAARALGPQIRLHGRSTKTVADAIVEEGERLGIIHVPTIDELRSKAWQKAENDDPADPVTTLSPLVGVSPDRAVSAEDDDAAAERRRHDGFLATAAMILAGAPIGDWQSLRSPAAAALEETYAGSARGTLKLLGFDASDTTVNQARGQFSLPPIDDPTGEELGEAIFEQMDRAAAAWARENAGELVGQLEESTRGMLAEEVARAVEEGWTDAQLTNHLAESYAFSETRAARIAQNELAVANRAGARIGIRRSNVATWRGWVTAGDNRVEADCRQNEAASPIRIDEEFPNGDDPHVGCRCAIIPWTEALDEENDLAAVSISDQFADLRKFEKQADEEENSSHIDPDHAVPVSLPLADPITEADVQHIAWTLVREGTAEFEDRTVPVEDLVGTQAVVDSERVADEAADFQEYGQDEEKLPLVVERHGLFYILAGHHHTCGAIAAGATELQVEVMFGEEE